VKLEWFEYIRSNELLAEVDEHTELVWGVDPTKEFRCHSEDTERLIPNHLITNLPTIAGITMGDYLFLMHMNGCAVANTNLVIHCAAHLYAACHYTGLISHELRWPDMDFFLKHHSMYTKNVPGSDPFTMVSHFHLALGAKGCSLASVRANPGQPVIRKVNEITSSSKFLGEHAKILSKARRSRHVGTVKSTKAVSLIEAMLEAFTNADCPKLSLQGKSTACKQKVFTPIELLTVMKQSLLDDEPIRNFNMIGFSQQCSTFLASAKEQTPIRLGNGTEALHPHVFTNYVLTQAAQTLDAGSPVSKTLLSISPDVLKKTIANGGDKYSKDAFARSSGPQLSPDARPNFPP